MTTVFTRTNQQTSCSKAAWLQIKECHPRRKQNNLVTLFVVTASKKEAVTGSLVETELLEFMLSTHKKKVDKGGGNQVPSLQHEESFVQCWQAAQCV